jgi:hypothetical protein
MASEEGIQERVWQGDDLENRCEAGACDLPERCLREVLAPEDLPASDGPSVGAEAQGKLADPAWCRSLPHGADEDDEDAEIDLWTKEADRRRGDSLPATVTIAAEAQSEALWLGKLEGSTPRLAEIVGAVQASAARARFLAGLLCKVLVDRQKDRPQSGGARQIVIHGRVLRSCEKLRSTPLGKLDPVIRLFEGNFLAASAKLLRDHGFHIDYLGHSHPFAYFRDGFQQMSSRASVKNVKLLRRTPAACSPIEG